MLHSLLGSPKQFSSCIIYHQFSFFTDIGKAIIAKDNENKSPISLGFLEYLDYVGPETSQFFWSLIPLFVEAPKELLEIPPEQMKAILDCKIYVNSRIDEEEKQCNRDRERSSQDLEASLDKGRVTIDYGSLLPKG